MYLTIVCYDIYNLKANTSNEMTYEGSDYSGSQPGGIWQYLVSEDIFGCHKWQNVISLC